MEGPSNSAIGDFNKTLTEEQKRTPSCFDWDDATLGRFVRAYQEYVVGWRKDGWDKAGTMAACMLIIGGMQEASVGVLSIEFNDVTINGEHPTDWKISFQKIEKAQ